MRDTAVTCEMLDVSDAFAERYARRLFSAAWYVRLRSRRKVSLNGMNGRKQIPMKMARNQNVARQLNDSVSTPPRSGPRDGPSRGALQAR